VSGVVMTDNGSLQERHQKSFFRLENRPEITPA